MRNIQVWLKNHNLFFAKRLRRKRFAKNKLGSYTQI